MYHDLDLSARGKGRGLLACPEGVFSVAQPAIQAQVLATRQIQRERFKSSKKVRCNVEMRSKDIQKCCRLYPAAQDHLKMAIKVRLCKMNKV